MPATLFASFASLRETAFMREYSRDHRSPTPKSETVSRVMSANKAKNTGPELLLRRALWTANLRGYRINKRIPIAKARALTRAVHGVRRPKPTPNIANVPSKKARFATALPHGRASASVRPDISYTKKKLAIFVHGCFWHHCPKCSPSLPKHNTPFWKAKFERNRERDARKVADLTAAGWRVLTFWECDLKNDLPA